jgi:starch phosphorylase
MKFMMNGAITIGTLDGANVEIRNAVGNDNIIIFGLTAQQVMDYYRWGGYNAWSVYHRDARIEKVMEQMLNDLLPDEREEFRPLYDYLLHHNDEFFVLKDFAAYADAQVRLEHKYLNSGEWSKMAITNIAHSGIFSSDRTISEYSIGLWKVKPLVIAD